MFKIKFKTAIYGHFCQNVIFDFGKPELLQKIISVNNEPKEKMEDRKSQFKLSLEKRWNEENVELVTFFER